MLDAARLMPIEVLSGCSGTVQAPAGPESATVKSRCTTWLDFPATRVLSGPASLATALDLRSSP